MTLASTAEQRELSESVHRFAARHAPITETRRACESTERELPQWWNELTASGFHAVHIPEQHGGQGGTLLDVACVLEAAGKASLPGPLLPTVIAGAIAALADSTPAAQDFLRSLSAGAAAAVALPQRCDLRARTAPDGWLISGTTTATAGSATAGLILLSAVDDDGARHWVAVDTAHPQVTVEPVAGTDLLADLGTVTVTELAVDASHTLTGIDDDRAQNLAVGLSAAMAAGITQWCVEAARTHLLTREQFGKPIGAFQAMQHSAAMLLVDSELANAAAWDALRAADDSRQQHRMATAATALITVARCPDLVLDTLTMLGAVGFTWEHELHLYWRRATGIAASIGTTAGWERQLGEATTTSERDFSVHIDDAESEFRAQVAETLDLAVSLPATGPGRQGDHPHFATGKQRTTLAEAGLIAPHWPPPWGLGATPLQQLIIADEFGSRADRLVRPSLGISEWILPSLMRAAPQPLQDKLIPPTMRGELAWCQLFSEPGAGSDLASLTTRAVRVDGGWRIDGHKIWTSAAHRADYGALLARTDPSAARHRGIGYFVVDMRSPGIEVHPIRQATGRAEFNEVFLTDVFVPDEMLLGEPTAGWDLAIATMSEERSAISGYVEQDRAEPLRRLAASTQGIERDDVIRELGSLDAYSNAIKAMGLREILGLIDGQGAGPTSSIAKVAMNVLLRRTFRAILRVAGDLAMIPDSVPAVVGPYLLMPAELIGGGTKEIQLNIIAQLILGLPRK